MLDIVPLARARVVESVAAIRPSQLNEGRNYLVHAVDVVHALAVLTVALLAARFLQAIGEHYFPDSEALTAARFIYGGP